MIREFLSMDKIFLFPKTNIYIANIKRLLGHGVTFSEGSVWKTKRKIVTSVFTFDFLQSIIPNISQICDSQIDKI
jgi:cytochrome P450